MEERRFDELTRVLGTATSRRQVLKGLLGGIVAAVVGGAVAIPRAEAAACNKKTCKDRAIRETFFYQNTTCNELCHDPHMAVACFGCQLNANRLYKQLLRNCEQGDGCLGTLVGDVCCFGECVNTGRDPRNCGGCANACHPGETCVDGHCQCGDQGTMCDGQCVDTQIDSHHCGSCDHACGTCQSCAGGQCGDVDCGPGKICCHDQCVDLCAGEPPDPTTCQCDPCKGKSDGTSCGSTSDLICCGEQCVSTASDRDHCGSCAPCRADQICVNSTCQCPAGTTECNGKCIDTGSDVNNCGSCGHQCQTCETCQNGTCVQAADNTSCGSGLVCCGGVCQASCGGTTCPSGQYVCQVTPPYTNNNNQRPTEICCPNGSPCCGGNGYFYDLCQPTTTDPTGVCCSPGTNQCGAECCDHMTQSCQQAADYSLHCCPSDAAGVLPDGTCCATGSYPLNCEGSIGWVCCENSSSNCCG